MLNANGYPKRFISRVTAPAKSSNGKGQDWEPKTTITVPYVAGVSEEIRRVCNTFDIRVAFRTVRTIRSELTRVKDPLPLEKQSMVVYRVPCACGQAYIGKTIRRLESRIKEHKDACNRGQLEKSAIAEHAWRHDHPIMWQNTQVLDRASRHKELLVKEALHIQMAAKNGSLNRDGGVEVHDCWVSAIRRYEQGSQYHHLRDPKRSTWLLSGTAMSPFIYFSHLL